MFIERFLITWKGKAKLFFNMVAAWKSEDNARRPKVEETKMAATNCNISPPFNSSSVNVTENFRKWKQQVQKFIMAWGLNAATLNFVHAESEDSKDPDVVMKKIEKCFTPKISEVYKKRIKSGRLLY